MPFRGGNGGVLLQELSMSAGPDLLRSMQKTQKRTKPPFRLVKLNTSQGTDSL